MRFVVVVLLNFFLAHASADEVSLAAATNLRYVLPELAEQFEQQTEHQLAISFAASGTLATQILHDAPFEVFLSANPDYVKRLVKAEKTKGAVVDYAQAQLAFYAANHSKLDIDVNLTALKASLNNGTLNKVVIANPKHAPYGQAAKAALQKAGIWLAIQPHLLIAENASQAVQFSMATSVDAGFLPYAHVIQAKLKTTGKFVRLDNTLLQQVVLLEGASEAAQQFIKFLQTDAASSILTEHGFVVEEKK